MVAAQTRQRDRVALLLLFRLGLRKGELSRVQFKHYDGRLCEGDLRQIHIRRIRYEREYCL